MWSRDAPPRSLEGARCSGWESFHEGGREWGEGEGEPWGLGTKGGKWNVSYHGWSLWLEAETRKGHLLKTPSSYHLAPTSLTSQPPSCQVSRTLQIRRLLATSHSTHSNQFSPSDVLPACLTSGWKDPPRSPPLLPYLSDPHPASWVSGPLPRVVSKIGHL